MQTDDNTSAPTRQRVSEEVTLSEAAKAAVAASNADFRIGEIVEVFLDMNGDRLDELSDAVILKIGKGSKLGKFKIRFCSCPTANRFEITNIIMDNVPHEELRHKIYHEEQPVLVTLTKGSKTLKHKALGDIVMAQGDNFYTVKFRATGPI